MSFIPFQTAKPYHKDPFGALCTGQAAVLRIVLPRALQCRAALLFLQAQEEAQEYPMAWDGMQGDAEEWWRVSLIAPEPGLYWYGFRLETTQGTQWIARDAQQTGILCAESPGTAQRFQLTVYDPAMRAPEWLPGGVYYQIFPDRFCKSGRRKQNVPPERILRNDWGSPPLWQPNADGSVTQYDYFGGDLDGIREKLPYLAELGVNCLYLNPIFEAHSNHRYDTADYRRIDPLLGDEADFRALCDAAREYGIHILLDGVFNHTGADSVYFNRFGRCPETGAFQSEESPYYDWYHFHRWPQDYACWWGVDILPALRKENEKVLDFFTGEDGIVRHWLRQGAAGWRLDVADELPDVFLDAITCAAKAEKPDSFVLGEVWEDASNKISYGRQRRYLLGKQLDSVMNYPFADAVLHFAKTGEAEDFFTKLLPILENYPPAAIHTLMNHIGTHDTLRALTFLAGDGAPDGQREYPALSPAQRENGLALMRLAAALQYTLPGLPCIYYGDEAGLEGGLDPFSRACFPWGKEDEVLLAWYRQLGALRRAHPVFRDGAFEPISAAQGCVSFARQSAQESILLVCNRSCHPIDYRLPQDWQNARPPNEIPGKSPLNGSLAVGAMHTAFLLREGMDG